LGKVLGRDSRYSWQDNVVGEGLGAVGDVGEGYEGLRGPLSLSIDRLHLRLEPMFMISLSLLWRRLTGRLSR